MVVDFFKYSSILNKIAILGQPPRQDAKCQDIVYLVSFFTFSDSNSKIYCLRSIDANDNKLNARRAGEIQMSEKPTYEELEKSVRDLKSRIAESNVLLMQEMAERKGTVEALRESERHIMTLLDFAPYPIVVFTLDGLVSYLNPAFTEVFGWDLTELEGKRIPYVPPELEEETSKSLKKLFEEKTILRHETRRLTKDGRVLDVIMRGALYLDSKNEPAGELVIVRDITREKRIAKNNEAMLRISMALPEYPDLNMLMDYISDEVRQLLGTEGGIVTLLDEKSEKLFFLGAS